MSTLCIVGIIHNSQKKWKQPKCPSMDEQINKMWSIHAVEYYAAMEGVKH